MAVETLTCFPAAIIAGDTVRLSISDGDYPSDDWSLAVVLSGPTVKSFAATAGDNNSFDLVITAAQSLELTTPGEYSVTYVYTETATSERASVDMGTTQVVADPTQAAVLTQAQTTLASMKTALASLSLGSNQTVAFNGQSFTKRNIGDLMDAIGRQQQVVDREQASIDRALGRSRSGNIYTVFGR